MYIAFGATLVISGAMLLIILTFVCAKSINEENDVESDEENEDSEFTTKKYNDSLEVEEE